MTASRRFTLTFVAAFALGGGGMASAYHTSFVSNNCNSAAPTPTPYITRDGSATVALRARYEGYQWAGGCWNDNDRDDAPGDPREASFQGGSAYRVLFRNGATLFPRFLCFVERKRLGALGYDAAAPFVVSRRSSQEKQPWKSLPGLEGRVEKLHPPRAE